MIRKIELLIQYYKKFGPGCFIATFLSKVFPYKEHGSKFSWMILQFKHRRILEYLNNRYYKARTGYVSVTKEELHNNCIWTAWLQGEKNAPEVVQLTLASIRKNSIGHKVIVLTNDNLDIYIDIPQEIKKKYTAGIISNAHYADVVRMMILSKYGGLWLDATTFVYRTIDNIAFSNPFYSVGLDTNSKSRFIADNKWKVGIIGGLPGSPYLSQISEMLNKYWIENDLCIDYFVFDYLVAVLYQNDTSFRSIVNSLPRMKFKANKLRITINEPYRPEILEELFVKNQYYMLTYKQNYKKKTADGKETVYGFLYNHLIGS